MDVTRDLARFRDRARLANDCLRALERRGADMETEGLEPHLIELCDRALEAYFWNDSDELARLAERMEETTRRLIERLARPDSARPPRARPAASAVHRPRPAPAPLVAPDAG